MFGLFRTILAMMEEFYEKKRFELNFARMKQLQKYGYSGLEVDDLSPEVRDILNNDENGIYDDELDVLEVLGIQLYRSFFFVSTYQYFESQLIQRCEKFGEDLNNPYAKGQKKNCLENCRAFLRNVPQVNVPSEALWDLMVKYNKLRNVIVHSSSVISLAEKGDLLRDFVNSNLFLHFPDLDEQKEVFGDIEYSVIFDQVFCEEAIDNFELFLETLDNPWSGFKNTGEEV